MDLLLECAQAYQKLLNVQYRIIIGRKGITKELCIVFTEWDFHHLLGLGKLKDIRLSRDNRKNVFEKILSGKITYETISKSRYIDLIENRFSPFMKIEHLLDSNRLIFRYNTKLNKFSLIEAEYLLTTPYDNNDIYIFLDKKQNEDTYFCKSFFPKNIKDYIKGQATWTLLYKEKIYSSTNNTEIQYDHLTYRNNPTSTHQKNINDKQNNNNNRLQD